MARVTVGIPVYNGETMLEECLTSVLAQTYQDIQVTISDNASDDRTSEICQDFAARDSRIQYIRQDENIGPLANFKFLLDQCETEYYLWRADDDYTNDRFLEVLIAKLDENPNAHLAVPRVKTIHGPEDEMPWANYSPDQSNDLLERLLTRFYNYHVSWFYGVWRTQYAKEICDRIWTDYPYAFAGDHLTILSPILDDAVVGDNEAEFIQRTYSPPKGNNLRGEITLSQRIERLETLLPVFYASYDKEIRLRRFDRKIEKRLLSERNRYAKEKLKASRPRIARLKLKRMLGLGR
ncbi:MAG: glycosyltransferase family 2 protein [Cohaesibacter sp.]|jgi:glycosyltransferase involved in cell wall biosynthesis|nr:glycosyltransferase family 2 protein [Cohaesibacter sp.]